MHDLGVFVGQQACTHNAAHPQWDGVVRRCVQGAQLRILALVGVPRRAFGKRGLASTKVKVFAVRRKMVKARNRFQQACGVHTDLSGQGL